MAEASIQVNTGTGPSVDVFNVTVNNISVSRQVVVLGDPNNGPGVATVDAVNGLSVTIKQSVPLTAITSFIGWKSFAFTNLTNTPLLISNLPGYFGGYFLSNVNSTPVTLSVYDANTATGIVPGTSLAKLPLTIPASQAGNLEIVKGVAISSGIVIAAATSPTNNTAPAVPASGFVLYL